MSPTVRPSGKELHYTYLGGECGVQCLVCTFKTVRAFRTGPPFEGNAHRQGTPVSDARTVRETRIQLVPALTLLVDGASSSPAGKESQ